MKFKDVKIGQRFAYTYDKIPNAEGYHWEFIKFDEENEKCVKYPEERVNDYRYFGRASFTENVVILDEEINIPHLVSLMENAKKAKKIFIDEVDRLFDQGRITDGQKEMLKNTL